MINKYKQPLLENYISSYLSQFGSIEEQKHAFIQKVQLEKEIKLKEFNFKILHGILPCNLNLTRWKIKQSNLCDVCDEPQTIEHLLYECMYVKPLWCIVNSTFGIAVNFKNILGMNESFEHNAIVTVICFFLYKEWLLMSLDNKKDTQR